MSAAAPPPGALSDALYEYGAGSAEAKTILFAHYDASDTPAPIVPADVAGFMDNLRGRRGLDGLQEYAKKHAEDGAPVAPRGDAAHIDALGDPPNPDALREVAKKRDA